MRFAETSDVSQPAIRPPLDLIIILHHVALDAEAENRQAGEEHRHAGYGLGRQRGVRLVEEDPDARSQPLPSRQAAALILFLEAERPRDFLVAELLALDVELIENRQGGLRVPVNAVRAPTARLYLRRVNLIKEL